MNIVYSMTATTSVMTGSLTMIAMSDQVQIAAFGAVVSLVTGGLTIYLSYKAKVNSKKASDASTEAKTVAETTGKAVNGKMEEFKKLAEAFYTAKGVEEGRIAAENKAAVVAAAKAEGKAEATPIKPNTP